jgi:hypothetical protein
MRKRFPSLPAVDAAIVSTLAQFGVDANKPDFPSDEEREIAERFDVKKALDQALQERAEAAADDRLITEEIKIYRAIKEFRLASLGLPELEIIADRLGIRKFLGYFFEHNISTAEYHSNYHAICVALNCYEGAQQQKLSDSETKCLVLAAIYHDFAHSGGTTDDVANVKRAISGLVLIDLLLKSELPDHNDLTIQELTQTIQILGITKYPYEKDPVTIMEMIIRDADLMQPYEEDPVILKNQYHGLHIEVERTYPTKFTSKEFANGQIEWLNTHVKWYSSWAKEKASALDWNKTKHKLFHIMNGT